MKPTQIINCFGQCEIIRSITGHASFTLLARILSLLIGASALAAAGGFGMTAHAASNVKVLFAFNNIQGSRLQDELLADGAGNLYGTTLYGGANDDGVVFELSPPAPGRTARTQTVLLNFNCTGGAHPHGSLILDGAGNLYGTTENGGIKNHNGGVAYEMRPPAGGQTAWTETVLHSFQKVEGDNPTARLLIDGAGNLYGTASAGGANHRGVVFELSPPAKGQKDWAETVLLTFDGANGAGKNPDPAGPSGGLIADGAGNLYGTTSGGGAHKQGELFELKRPEVGDKHWTQKVLYSFNGKRGANPSAGLIADSAGNLYGTTYWGGEENADGVVFEHAP